LDDGITSVKSLRAANNLDFDFDVIPIDYNSTEDEDFIKLCGKGFSKLHPWTKTKKLVEALTRKIPSDATVIIDNLSSVHEYILDDIREDVKRRQLQIQDWGTFVDEITIFLSTIRKMPCNVIIIAHEEFKKDPLTEQLLKFILMPTKSRYRIPAVVTDFLYMSNKITGPRKKRVVSRVIQSTPDAYTNVGSRALIPDIINPTYARMRPFLTKALNRDLGEPTWTPPDPKPTDVSS
jgi:hypothetical protein